MLVSGALYTSEMPSDQAQIFAGDILQNTRQLHDKWTGFIGVFLPRAVLESAPIPPSYGIAFSSDMGSSLRDQSIPQADPYSQRYPNVSALVFKIIQLIVTITYFPMIKVGGGDVFPSFLGGGDSSMLVGPDHPLLGRGTPTIPGVPPGARFDPFGPAVPQPRGGFQPFPNQPRPAPRRPFDG